MPQKKIKNQTIDSNEKVFALLYVSIFVTCKASYLFVRIDIRGRLIISLNSK